MAIYDINGDEIVHHQNFPNDPEVENIEIGANKNCFGKKYFPCCYLTDIEPVLHLPHFTQHAAYDYDNSHFLDYVGDFFGLTSNRTFTKVIFCNPYGFGFRGEENAKVFLNKAGEILSNEGQMLVIGNSSNGWSSYDNATKWLARLSEEQELNWTMQISDLVILDENHEIRKDHTFRRQTVDEPAIPNQMYFIKKIA